MKKIFATVLGCLMVLASSASAEVNASKAEAFVKDVTAEGIEDIINANIPQAEKDARFSNLSFGIGRRCTLEYKLLSFKLIKAF